MARHMKPVVLFTPGGVEEDVDRDFSVSYDAPNDTDHPSNPTADQMVRGEYGERAARRVDEIITVEVITPEIVDPKDPPVTEPVTIQKPPSKVPPAKPVKQDAS